MNAQIDPIEPNDTNMDERLQQAKNWLTSINVIPQTDIRSVAGDASFRRYFRVQTEQNSLILMDAPPPAEDVRPFIDVASRLSLAGLHAPVIIHADEKNGFLLLEDLGDDMYRDLLTSQNADQWFPGLFAALATMATKTDATGLAQYDADKLRFELNLLPNWYLKHHRPAMPRAKIDAIWGDFCEKIMASAFEQPQCFVHRDFHSSNLLKAPDGSIGIIDFQDAVNGPVSYDFISLIWDRYISWPRAQIEQWMEDMREQLKLDMSAKQWRRYCDLMGLQRNIKIVGIFARLYYRDGKQGYIEMIPRFYDYLLDTLKLYPEFSDMLDILEHEHCVP
jgi:aminoglycoside/choline kinase family phosphotransferase